MGVKKALFLVIFLGITVFFMKSSQAEAALCNQLDSTKSVPSGYGASFNPFSTGKELLVSVFCESSGEVLTVGNNDPGTFIYKLAYEYRGEWQPYNLTGSDPTGDWFLKRATASFPPLETSNPGTGYAVGYTCQKVSNVWKCGCRDTSCSKSYWQLQSFPKTGTMGSQVNQALENHDGLLIAYPSRYDGPVGTSVTITGAGFTPSGNTVKLGTHQIAGIGAITKSSLTFTVPNSISPGVYPISVQNSRGLATSSSIFVVTKPGASVPVITSVTPNPVKYGESVVITGRNFTPTGNMVRSTFRVYKDLPSTNNGTKITLPVKDWFGFDAYKQYSSVRRYTTVFFVVNENGISSKEKPGTFLIDL